jgi:hypothetical protein
MISEMFYNIGELSEEGNEYAFPNDQESVESSGYGKFNLFG